MVLNKSISVVVPCYMDEGNIKEMVNRLSAVLSSITKDYEIIFVNDASPDNSEKVLEEVARIDKRITVINHSRNFGVMSVFDTGMQQAVGDAVVLMDGDLQDPPELISEFVKKWLDGYLVVYGIRVTRDESVIRKAGYYLFYNIWAKVSDIRIPKYSGEFSLLDRKIVDMILSMRERERFLRGLRAWVGFPQIGVPYHRPDRFAGSTTQSLRSYFSWAIKATISFSSFPLRLVGIIAIIFSCILALFFTVNIILFLCGIHGPKGFLTLLGVTLSIGTVQLICTAIISEYLNIVFKEVKSRPISIIRSIINDHKKNI